MRRVVASAISNISLLKKSKRLTLGLNKIFLKLGFNPIVQTRLKDGSKYIVDLRSFEYQAFYYKEYDSPLLNPLKLLLKSNSTVIDVGANIGFYSVSLGRRMREINSKGKIYAFEPCPSNYQRLKENIKLNDLDSTLVNTFKFGLSDKEGKSTLTLRQDFKGGSETGNAAIPTSIEFDKKWTYKEIKIDLKKFDDIWSDIGSDNESIDLIKIDIEGHEDFFLRGGINLIKEHRPIMLMEVAKPYYESRGVDLENIFSECIPEKYVLLRRDKYEKWIKSNINQCNKIDDIFWIPLEKLEETLSVLNES